VVGFDIGCHDDAIITF